MTDFDPDELVSAVLDGEATADDRARVEADPALSARLAELRTVHDALVGPTPLPRGHERDAAIAAAIRTAPIDLQQRRQRRQRLRQIASIAAAVLVFAGVVAGISALSRRDSHSNSSSAVAASSTPAGSEAGAAGNTAAADAAPSAASRTPNPELSATAPVVADLGAFATSDALVTAVRQANSQFRQQTVNPTQAVVPDQSAADTDSVANGVCPSQAGTRLYGNAQLEGQPVVVVVRETPNAEIIAVYDTSCRLLFSQPA